MAIFDKLLPWKRKGDLGLKDNLGLGGFGADNPGMNMGMPGLGGLPPSQFADPMQQPLGMPQYPGQQQAYPSQQQFSGMSGFQQQTRPQVEAFQQNQAYERSYAAGKEMEIVSAKLDAIKAALETLNQRLAGIERYIQSDQEFKKRGGW